MVLEMSKKVCYDGTNAGIACLISRKQDNTAAMEGPYPLHGLHRRPNRLHNGILSHTCLLLYTIAPLRASMYFYSSRVCVLKHCVGHGSCLHGVFLVFSKACRGGILNPPRLAAGGYIHARGGQINEKTAHILHALFEIRRSDM